MGDLEVKNRYFDRLFNNADLKWLGQNTNHLPMHPAVRRAMHEAVDEEGFHAYAPPAGMEALRGAIVADLGLVGKAAALVTDGGVAALGTACRALCRPGRRFVTTDPGWKWPLLFARQAGMEVVEIPIYGEEYGWRLSPERLAAAMDDKTDVVYLVDPNNPLGICYTADEIAAFADICRQSGATLIHDCTYRDFADHHTPAASLWPEGTVTVVSFSKWLGLAGLRVGALVAAPDRLESLGAWSIAPLGASVIAQKAALAGIGVKAEWMETVQAVQRGNQAMIREAVERIPGMSVPVFPSQANFLVVELAGTGVKPEALVAAYGEAGIMIRQGAYHTPRFGDRFVKVSTTVPTAWAADFCDRLPAMLDMACGLNDLPPLF